jgi:hypothetical protein
MPSDPRGCLTKGGARFPLGLDQRFRVGGRYQFFKRVRDAAYVLYKQST